MNRLSYPRKFALAGALFALPLIFVMSQNIGMLNERVDATRRELAGIRTIRSLTSLWHTMYDFRASLDALPPDSDLVEKSNLLLRYQNDLSSHLERTSDIEPEYRWVLQSSARWASLKVKLQMLLDLSRTGDKSLQQRAIVNEVIRDMTTTIRQVAEVSNLMSDSHLDTQNLAYAITRQIPDIIESQNRVWETVILNPETAANRSPRSDLDAIESMVGLKLSLDQLQYSLMLAGQDRDAPIIQLQSLHTQFRATVGEYQQAMRDRMKYNQNSASREELEKFRTVAAGKSFEFHNSCVDAMDMVIGRRCAAVQWWRLFLVLSALLPAGLAMYLGLGFCLAVIRTVERLREVTDRVLANDWRNNNIIAVEAQDELGRMIADFGRLTVRLRDECAAARAEAQRAYEAEESLRISEERFALALRGTNDGIWDWDLLTDRVFYSPRFKELLGYGEEEFGVWLSAMSDVLHPDDFDATWAAVERHLRERVPYNVEHRLRTKSGEYRWFLDRAQAVWNDDGVAVRMAGSVSDITDRKRAEEENAEYLRQVEASRDRIADQSKQLRRQAEELARAKDEAETAARVKSEFLANMSHELRTPLTAILGYADMLYEEGDLARAPVNRLETIDVIRTNGRHLQELIDDILDLSKIEAGRMTVENLAASPIQLVEGVLKLMNLRAKEKRLSLRFETRFPFPSLVATDELRVRQVLVNLIGNAIKFTGVGGVSVVLSYNHQLSQLSFEVRDSGIGMSPERMSQLFSPFSQGDNSMSRRFGGTGLGLSISRRLANLLGGDVSVESEEGVGSTFTLTITAQLAPESIWLTAQPAPAPIPGTLESLQPRLLSKADPIAISESNCAPSAPSAVMKSETISDAESAANNSMTAPKSESSVVKPTSVVEKKNRLHGRILLAEDVEANQKLISFLLTKNGAEVDVAENGRIAVEMALKSKQVDAPYDLILMDLQMPEMDGYQAATKLREHAYTGRIVALTAHATEDHRQECLAIGFDGFATKPIEKNQLIATCFEHLNRQTDALTNA